MKRIIIDFETRGSIDLKKCGAYRYAADTQTSILCLGYSVDGAKPVVLTAAQIARGEFFNFATDIGKDVVFVAHNFQFETAVWESIMHKRLGYPALSDARRWSCTLSRGAMCNLPLSLAECGAALGIAHKKDLTGRGVMLKLSRPIDTDPISGEPVYNNDPALFETLHSYCAADVAAEVELDKKLPELPPSERLIFELDAKINAFGVQMDTDLAKKATALAGTLTAELNERLVSLTAGAVTKASRVAEMKRWVESQGIKGLTSLDKEAVNGLLARADISQTVKDVLSIRRQAGKSSTAKFEAVTQAAGSDGRLRGAFQYHAASTGRWGGRLVQLHNLPKGLAEAEQIFAIDAIKESPDVFSLIYGDKGMDTLSGCTRGAIVAAPGKRLVVADYNAIEPRVLFWLADDQSALGTYRAGGSPYLDMGAFIFKKPITKKDTFEYAVAKFTVLGAGYGMGAPRFQAQCATTGLTISLDMAAQAVRAYREKYSSVKKMWYAVEAAAKKAIRNPGVVVPSCNEKVWWGMSGDRRFLAARLPSGRHLRYFQPSIKAGEYGEEIHYMAPGLGGKLEDQKTYGASLVENAVQAIARDFLAHGMLAVEANLYPIVLHVHDEIGSEIDGDETTWAWQLKEFIKLMCKVPKWGAGCPLAAEGWIGERYRK